MTRLTILFFLISSPALANFYVGQSVSYNILSETYVNGDYINSENFGVGLFVGKNINDQIGIEYNIEHLQSDSNKRGHNLHSLKLKLGLDGHYRFTPELGLGLSSLKGNLSSMTSIGFKYQHVENVHLRLSLNNISNLKNESSEFDIYKLEFGFIYSFM
ncbi:hypothetical protein ACOMICROBIO_LMKGKHOH_03936 [Vibrio sp. B1FIG11]|uniref:outer membrane beta-barrel protein n=1 Tax=Vibrio sp. B1FIG11 TaxID=2751177 RepID=UPI001AF8FC13|nr:outer membrane beta-barrel protein [Vibrio sp. B1FIG11]CAD7826893.1 hypothetical protein ACOMICROBIO_LMKGKHOH_03936 [Vibrio sp. B1FIG11]CAE6962021.1 hypothetical protein ACOMICROBIO_LMKGKHOH_03936 [Vibrio sp. B1FIG11]